MPAKAKKPPPEPILISVKEAAAMLGISRNHAYALLNEQAIASRYIGRRRLVVKASLQAFVERLPTTPPGR